MKRKDESLRVILTQGALLSKTKYKSYTEAAVGIKLESTGFGARCATSKTT